MASPHCIFQIMGNGFHLAEPNSYSKTQLQASLEI